MPSTADSNPTVNNASQEVVTIDRRTPGAERRGGDPNATDVGAMTNPRRKKQRRRHIDPTTCERDYSNPEIEFMRAMDDYKRRSGRMFPTCSEVLEVIKELGYYKLNDDQIDALGLDECDEDSVEWDESWDDQEQDSVE
ncbi:hypothetical protein LOC67_19255 [Stieleria sp. JC731]|uniref:hypothetical protein n=1 Tax=Pirellulaceae TaxID=2691357 RepID=UPI001E57137E|nr:hypothetical protein [Stieleria sp. JC731]MCC9602694.1 hypothetical protein [Stieleria sp. JC731]